jgi:hypothetical protein
MTTSTSWPVLSSPLPGTPSITTHTASEVYQLV